MPIIVSVENLSKVYRLGQIGTGTFAYDLALWWAQLRGRPNPLLKVGESDRGNRVGEDLWALRDVSFQVEKGEALGIIGPNGAGKSTLLKILSRVTAPTSGRVKIKGRVASLLEVGTGFHPDLTGRENIYLNGAILGMDRREIDRKFDEIVDFAGIAQFVETPVKRYSSGMYVRLAFAVAAHLDPEILVVDEVLAVGDAEFQKKCLGKMGDVARGGKTVLFVSHNMGAVSNLCSRAVLLRNGVIADSGPVDKVILAYTSSGTGFTSGRFLRPRRDCTSRVMITGVNLGAPASFGDPLELAIDYMVRSPVDRFSVEWFIRDAYGQRVLSGLSVSSDRTWFKPCAETGRIHSCLEQWRLHGGKYSLSVILTNPGIECMDYVENAVYFAVADQSPNGTNFLFTSRHGLMLPEVSWQAAENTEVEYE